MNGNLQKVALVTGSARGIGLATAKRFLADGWRVALLDIDGDNLQRAYAALGKPDLTLAITCDVSDGAGVSQAIATIKERFGRLDALVNNASAFFDSPLETTTAGQWDTLFAVNARAPFLLCQAAANTLGDTGGSIVNLSDLHAARPRPDILAYAASKAALEALTRGMAATLGPQVRVNAVAPGAILWPEGEGDADARAAMLARTPLARTGTVEEIAETVRWLLMDAGFVTGQVLHVDGGRDAHWV
jgi:pteridine reductase